MGFLGNIPTFNFESLEIYGHPGRWPSTVQAHGMVIFSLDLKKEIEDEVYDVKAHRDTHTTCTHAHKHREKLCYQSKQF